MNRIENKFSLLKKEGKKAFIAFITAGYPNLKITEELIYEFGRQQVDILELGVPFSDPLADGPVIQEASEYALKANTHLEDIIGLVGRARKFTDIPICLMTYYNPVFCLGEEGFVRKAKFAGVDGLIIPDLPPEEAINLRRLASKSGLANIFFISPTTTKERVKFINQVSRGFIYYVSLTGVTGARKKLAPELLNNLKAVNKLVTKPLCVGFGISTPRQVREISPFCSGIIVGSAIVKKIKENLGKPHLVKKAADFVSSLRKGLISY